MVNDEARPAGEINIASAVLMTAVGGYIDAFLFLRHQVFGFAQTGNVIFLAVDLVKGGDWVQYVWPLLAYIAGLTCAQVLRTRRPDLPSRTVTAAMGFQVVVFAVLAVLPGTAPAALLVVTLSFVGGVRLELFRAAAGISFVSIATTGNLMRAVEAIGDFVRGRSSDQLRAIALTVAVVVGFIGGAVAGALLSQTVTHALWGAVLLEAASMAVFAAASRRPSTAGGTPQ
ncbi:DUF1275 domain-containing protein [Gordonia sp. TBRC 11910]|uniref:DUF1275 domain-containing protein n=1 Tax=Gordonia asplenii TaxID=2725283 RepID=A0A848KUT1_9ACTN|nr:YoaK family protein [Gordonia asplenii]NMN99940.1 DUF1275 domain-containing protein [Gordonia asplenii]